jgi:hypothetical protein
MLYRVNRGERVFTGNTSAEASKVVVGSPHVLGVLLNSMALAGSRGNTVLTIIMTTEQSSPTVEATVLESIADIQVFDSDGGIVRFGDIFADQKTIVVFIRTHTNPLYLFIDTFVCLKGIFSVE